MRERESNDNQNHMFSHSVWQSANESTRRKLNNKVKEPQHLLFFKGAVYECTYNKDMKFSQSQICIIINLPSQDDLDHIRKIEVIMAPPGIQDVTFDENKTQNEYISDDWKIEKIGISPSKTIKISNIFQAERNQYGLKYRITSTIHASMGNTLKKVATEISDGNESFKLWDKTQVIVAYSRIKVGKHHICWGLTSNCKRINY